MSIKLMSMVWESDLPSSEKFVLLALADHGRDDGSRIYPSIRTLAIKTGFNKRTVQRQIRHLQSRGILSVVKKSIRYGSTEYFLHADRLSSIEQSRDDNQSPLEKSSSDPGDTSGVAIKTFRGGNKDIQGRHTTTQTIIESSFNHQENRKSDSLLNNFSEWDRLFEVYPKRTGGIVIGRDRAKQLFLKSTDRARIIKNAICYTGYPDAKSGFVMGLDKFVQYGYRDFDEPPKPTGESPAWKPNTAWKDEIAKDRAAMLEYAEKEKRGEVVRPRPKFMEG